jgi:hypothetical protein
VHELSLFALLLACSARTSADDYRDAMNATDRASARAACARLPEDARAECYVTVFDRLGGERSDCDVVPEGVWRDECVFLYAEDLAAAGNVPEAITTCGTTRFGRECSFHLVRAAVERVVDQPVATAAEAIAPYRSMPLAPDAPRLFWRTWFRDRYAKDIPIDPSGCADDECRAGAREALYFSLASLANMAGDALCGGPRIDGRSGDRALWVDDDVTRAWVAEWTASECRRRGQAAGGAPE